MQKEWYFIVHANIARQGMGTNKKPFSKIRKLFKSLEPVLPAKINFYSK
jgi:hypothetical protein